MKNKERPPKLKLGRIEIVSKPDPVKSINVKKYSSSSVAPVNNAPKEVTKLCRHFDFFVCNTAEKTSR